MGRRWKQLVILLVVAIAAAQLIRPEYANPPTDASRAVEAHMNAASGLGAVLNRSCRDCHSNATVWPWYTKVAPLSWLMAYGVTKGRKAVNFSEWDAYSPQQQQLLLSVSCSDVRQGKMPGVYALLHPEMRLSADDVNTICAAAQQADLQKSPGR